ncbi:CarD family transcriptional regulator [Neobacillus niacini]|uniref:CarD family transcriptional regulator n=1 Tax=Neobacillus niacini TaxID=86668 RepID=UPI0027897C6F|nr:CarD family transcriptional regulator [Neobacillus niacini]MDQ1003044.1 CarD family transcriptional regulator [Neobacillus niacini]
MYNIGDLVIYSAHGICEIDDICDKTVSGITRSYYVLHPMDNKHHLTISIPVDNELVAILDLIQKEEAQEILESFKYPGVEWNEKPNLRLHLYSDLLNTGERKEIAKVINTLMRKKIEAELRGKKQNEQDRKLLTNPQNILFKELALSLNTTYEVINEMVIKLIKENS